MRRLVPLVALIALAACSNSDPVKRPPIPPVVSTTTINYSTYLGNDLADVVRDVARDAQGNLFLVGGALSTNLLPGTPTRAHAGNEDAFVAKFDGNGQVVWWTFLGGPGPDRGYAIELDPNGDLVIGGGAAAQFPVTPGAVLEQFQGGAGACDPTQLAAQCTVDTTNPARDGFVAKLAGANGALVWATYFGSGRFELDSYVDDPMRTDDDNVTDFNDDNDPRTSIVRDIAVDPAGGEIYLTFSVAPSALRLNLDGVSTTIERFNKNLPPVILAALQNGDRPGQPGLDALGSGIDGILAKLAPDGDALIWATFVGGMSNESDASTVRLDAQGNPVILIGSLSFDRIATIDPVTFLALTRERIAVSGYDLTLNATDSSLFTDLFLAKYALDGPLIWSTYVGGRGDENIDTANFVLRSDDTVVLAAQTVSTDFTPINAGSFDSTFNGTTISGGYFSGDCALATIAPDGDSLLATTYYGGAGGDACSGVAVDAQDRIYVSGGTTSVDLPIRSGPHQAQRPGPFSAFLAVFSSDLGTLLHSGYFGGTGLGNSNQLLVRASDATSASVIFAGAAEAAYPLASLSGPPVRGTVTAPPAHGVLSDVTIQLLP